MYVTMRVEPNHYKGIVYVRMGSLPPEQRELILTSPSFPERIKILIDGRVYDDCLLFSDYAHWFAHIFKVGRERNGSTGISVSLAHSLVEKKN